MQPYYTVMVIIGFNHVIIYICYIFLHIEYFCPKEPLFFLGEANTGVFKAYTKNHISMHLHGHGKVTPSDFSASFQGRRLKFGTLLHIME